MTQIDPSRLKVAMDALTAAPEFFPSANELPNGVVEIRRTDRAGAAASAPTPGEAIKMAYDMTQRARAQSVLIAMAEHDRAKVAGDRVEAVARALCRDYMQRTEDSIPLWDSYADSLDEAVEKEWRDEDYRSSAKAAIAAADATRAHTEHEAVERLAEIAGLTRTWFGDVGISANETMKDIHNLATRPLADAQNPPASSTNEAYHFQSEPTASLSSAAAPSDQSIAAQELHRNMLNPPLPQPGVPFTREMQELIRRMVNELGWLVEDTALLDAAASAAFPPEREGGEPR